MGSFSWNKADNLGKYENVAYNTEFKFLIPKEFGGGFIQDVYQDYGRLGKKEDGSPKYDMYEILAFWNNLKGLKFDEGIEGMKEIDEYTDDNRSLGINEGCYDDEIEVLKYPLKLVSVEYEGTYEDCENRSYIDPAQGFYSRERE